VLSGGSAAEKHLIVPELIIPNYVNSQSLCLSTASLFAVCCENECEGLLSSLERQVREPYAYPKQLARLVTALPGPRIARSLLGEIDSLVDPGFGRIALHGRKLAGWMHRAFPLACPAPLASSKVANPKTPDEWIGEGENLEVKNLEEMMGEVAEVLARYTTMGKAVGAKVSAAQDAVSDPSLDVIRIEAEVQPQTSERNLLATVFRLGALVSMMALVTVAAAKSMIQAKTLKGYKLQKL